MNPCQSAVSMSDALLSKMVQFFDDGLFNRNVIDLLVQIAADALNVNIFKFQNNSGEIQVLNYRCGEFGKTIYMKYSHNNYYSVGNHYEPLVKLQKLNRTVPWPSNLMKLNATNNNQELLLDLSQSTQSATEGDVPEQSPTEGNVPTQHPVQLDVSSPIQLVYRKESNCGEEIIYIQNIPIFEDDSDQPTAYININTPDNANVNEDTEDRDYIPDENQNNSEEEVEEEVEEEQINVSQKEINEALNNIKPGKTFPTWLHKGVKEECVPRIPENINGLKKYKIQVNEDDDWHKLTGDCRYFTMRSSSNKNLFGRRKIGLCCGS